ncbi:MAG: choice-of-anchor J domain-containing protein [Bacteroidales bacterium]|nr:choice-of-anchor J domain-containing protein [Bacteroidales bacterium]
MKKILHFSARIFAILMIMLAVGLPPGTAIPSDKLPSGDFVPDMLPDDPVVIGTSTQIYLGIPVNAWYGYSFSQTLYLQSELNVQDKVIERVGYHYAGSTVGLDFQIEIWMSHTQLTELTQTVQLTDFIKVYDGTWVCNPGTAFSSVEIDPFYYNNQDNLIITVIEKKPGYTSSSDVFYATPTEAGNNWCIGLWNDGSAYNPNNLPAANTIPYRANTKLWFGNVPTGPAVAEITPLSLDFGIVELGEGKIKQIKIKNIGADPLNISGFSTDNDVFQVVNASFPISLGMNESQYVDIRFMPVEGNLQNGIITFDMDGGGNNKVNVSGKGIFFEPVIIGAGTDQSYQIPVNSWYGYSFSQTLYLQSEIDIPGRTINRVGYNYNGPSASVDYIIEVWIAHTSLTQLTASVPLAGFTKVYDGPFVVLQEDDFSFVEIDPFFYNNTDNLIITIIEKKPGYTSTSDVFMTTPVTTGSMCVGAWNDSAPYDPNALPAGSVVAQRANTKLWFSGDIPTEPEAKTQPASLYFGEVETSVTKTLTVEVMNAGGGILEITGATITNPAFTVINATFPVALSIGQKEFFEIQFAPVEPGLEEGLLTFDMDESIPGSKTVDLSGRALRFGVLRESFEGVTFPPLGWKIIDNNKDGKGWLRNTGFVPTGQTAPRTGIAAASLDVYAGSPSQISYDDWLVTPRMVWQDGDLFKFYIKRVANQAGQKWRVCLSTSGTDVSDFVVIDEIIDPPLTYGEKAYDLSNYGLYNGDKFYIGIQFYSLWCWPGVIDDVLGSVLDRYENDLMVMDFTGPDLLYKNATGNYQVKMANYGLSAVAQDAYQTQICAYINGTETVLASLPGQALGVSEIATVTIPLSVASAGVYDIYAKIVWNEDLEPNNNFSDMITLEVIPASIVVKNIGDFPISSATDYTNYYPIDFEDIWRSTSLTECLYYKNELNTGGVIERLTYYTQFGADMNQRSIKIYIGETSQNSLDGAYIPPSQLKLVFDGKMDFDEGTGKVDFELTEPYVYAGGGNLVINVYYYNGGSSNEPSKFAYTEASGYPRTFYETGWQAINPEAPVYFGTVTNYPNTSLRFETGNGIGALSGKVYYLADNAPVQGAKVEIFNPAFPDATAVVYTNAQGSYSAPYAMAGSNLTVTVSKFGYVDQVYENVNLPAGGTKNLGNAYLGIRTKIALSGSVFTSDTEEPVRFATVKLFGMENYETTTGVTGEFVFDEIWGSTSYQIEVSYEGYQTYIATIAVPDTDYVLDPITILENAPAPNLVNAQEQGEDALITWYAAGQPYPMEFRYDDGVVAGRLITPGTPTIFGGAAWPYNAIINSVTWFNFPSESYPASPMVRILILGITENGVPDETNQLALFEEVPQVYGWNTYQLGDMVNAPDGFFVGIAGYSNYTVLGYDDGVGEPYEWIPRTQWGNGLGSYNPLENGTSPPLHASIMVRAGGLVYGESVKSFAPLAASVTMPASDESLLSICQATEPFDAGDPKAILPYIASSSGKSFMHYNVFTKELDGPDWVQVNTAPVYDTSFIDSQWSEKTFGLYQYGVEAEYTNGVKSALAKSNVIEKNMRLDLTLIVNTNTGVAGVSAGALVKLINQNGNVNDIYNATVGPDGSVIIEDIKKGTYNLEITLAGFDDYMEPDIDLMIEEIAFEKTVELIEHIFDPYDLEITTQGQLSGVANFKWNQEPVFDNVEGYAPFLINNIGDWTVVDQDNQPTVTINGISFPHMGDPFGFITLNRSLTTPPLSEAYWGARSGSQYFAAFASAQGNTSNWLISPEQNHSLPYTFSFYAKSVNDAYGLETFRIAYSTGTSNLSNFTYITGNVSALTYWTKFTYTIPAEAKFVAIRHTHTGFALLIDDLLLGVEADNAIPANGFTVYLDDAEIATGLMTSEYDFTGVTPGPHTAGVKAHFYTGESDISEVEFVMPEGVAINFTVQDDKGVLLDGAQVSVLFGGNEVFTGQTINGLIDFGLTPGIYQYMVSYDGLVSVSGEIDVTDESMDIEVVLNHYYTLTFEVIDNDSNAIRDAMVTFNNQTLATDVNGVVSFVAEPGTYPYAVTHLNYVRVLNMVVLTDDQSLTVVMNDLSCEAPTNLTYLDEYNKIQLSWQEPDSPVTTGTWLHWDGQNTGNSVGTGGPVDFDVAQRFEPADLAAHDGKFLTRILFLPREASCTYSVRAWVGGNIAAPEMMIVDQVVQNPVIGQWNEVFLNIPVFVDASKELWIGFRSNTTTGHPAGCDVGPAINGKGNMINLAGQGWQTLLEAASTLNFNWNVRGLLEEMDAKTAPAYFALNDSDRGEFSGKLSVVTAEGVKGYSEPFALLGYNIYRDDVKLNDEIVTATTFEDILSYVGFYYYGVTAVYNNGCESGFSNILEVGMGYQPINLRHGWSIVSSHFIPETPQLDELFSQQIQEGTLEIMLGKSGLFWPGQNINMIGDWNVFEGYKVKMNQLDEAFITGELVEDKTVSLAKGVSYLPMLSIMPVAASEIFNQISGNLSYAFDITNGLIWWPEGGIYTLESLVPGSGYLVSMSAPGTVTYPDINGFKHFTQPRPADIANAPQTVLNTGVAHLISISAEALKALAPGDIIAAFNSMDLCVGMAQVNGDNTNLGLVVFGNDFTTGNIDGMMNYEKMQFSVYKASTMEELTLTPEWNLRMPDTDMFVENGLSAIRSFKLGAVGVGEQEVSTIRIYPNPATDVLFIAGEFAHGTYAEIYDQLGKSVMRQSLQSDSNQLDVSQLNNGVYMVKIATDKKAPFTYKLIIR